MEKLSKYAVIEINMEHRMNGDSKIITRGYRACNDEDFLNTGIFMSVDYKK